MKRYVLFSKTHTGQSLTYEFCNSYLSDRHWNVRIGVYSSATKKCENSPVKTIARSVES